MYLCVFGVGDCQKIYVTFLKGGEFAEKVRDLIKSDRHQYISGEEEECYPKSNERSGERGKGCYCVSDRSKVDPR